MERESSRWSLGESGCGDRAPVELVEKKRRSHRTQVDADLVVAARERAHRDATRGVAVSPPDPLHVHLGDRGEGSGLAFCRGPGLPLAGGVKRRLDAEVMRRRRSRDPGEIGLLDRSVFKGKAQVTVDLGRAGEEDDSGDISVDAVDDEEPRPEHRLESTLERLLGCLTARRDDDGPRGFVDREDAVAVKEHGPGQRHELLRFWVRRPQAGGETGIRTLGAGVTDTRDFQSRRISHSRISPQGGADTFRTGGEGGIRTHGTF